VVDVTDAAPGYAPPVREQKGSGRLLLVVVVVALLLRVFLFEQFYVQGPSMEPTLFEPSRVVVEKLTGGIRDVSRGDVVVFQHGSGSDSRDLIKRVIALPGERVALRGCVVYVDSVALREPYVEPSVNGCGVGDLAEQVVPAGRMFVLGDNREESADSRSFGPVSISRVVGRAVAVVWPPSEWGRL